MRVEAVSKGFSPISMHIALESEEEASALYALFNCGPLTDLINLNSSHCFSVLTAIRNTLGCKPAQADRITDELVRRFSLENTVCELPVFDPEKGVGLPGRPHLVAARREGHGMRVILGVNGHDDEHDLLIERHADKWLILLHGNGSDPILAINITDTKMTVEDGRGDKVYELDVKPVLP